MGTASGEREVTLPAGASPPSPSALLECARAHCCHPALAGGGSLTAVSANGEGARTVLRQGGLGVRPGPGRSPAAEDSSGPPTRADAQRLSFRYAHFTAPSCLSWMTPPQRSFSSPSFPSLFSTGFVLSFVFVLFFYPSSEMKAAWG